MAPIRIILADDHRVVRAGLRALIDRQPEMAVIDEASDGIELLACLERGQPDVVVMDLSMPRLGGIEATYHSLKRCPKLRVLVLSVYEDGTYLRQVLEAGAAGYVLKRSAAEFLIEAIRQVTEGRIFLDPALGNVLAHTLLGTDLRTSGNSAILSDREAAVLQLIAQGYSNKEIAAQLDVSVKTVETYKARAMTKLGISSRVEIVRYAAAHGWLSQP